MRVLRWALALPALVAFYLLAAVAGALIPSGAGSRTGPAEIEVGLYAGAIHYDFLLPLTPGVRARFAFAEGAGVRVLDPASEWLMAGWGAEAFYTTTGTYADVSLGATWKGITGDGSVIRLEAFGPIGRDGIEWVRLDAREFERLVASIEADLAPDRTRLRVPSRDGSAFFASPRPFDIVRTCNVWVGEKLRAAGLRFGRWTPTTFAVRLSLWRFGLAE